MEQNAAQPIHRLTRLRGRRVLSGTVLAGTALAAWAVALASPALAAGSLPPACSWTPQSLATLAPAFAGGVNGTDGDQRFAGVVIAPDGWNHAAVWQNGRLVDLGRPLAAGAEALDVNRFGVTVGQAFDGDYYQHAYLWRGEVPVALAEPAGADLTAAVGVSDTGIVAGYAEFFGPGTEEGSRHAVVWSVQTPNEVRDLGSVGSATRLTGITDRGRLVGIGDELHDSVALSGTVESGLRPLSGTSQNVTTHAQGAAGNYTVGSEYISGDGYHPVRWTGGHPEQLPAEPGSYAKAVNVQGLTVGSTLYGDAALIWDRGGEPTRLSGNANTVTDDGRVGGSRGPNPVVWSCG